MKCKDCSVCRKGFYLNRPEDYVCIGVKHPFVIEDINVECTEYSERREALVYTAKISEPKPAKAYVGDDGIYVPSRYDFRCHELLISKETFVEAYNKWIKGEPDVFDNTFSGEDDADDWCDD